MHQPKKKLLDMVRDKIRLKHYSYSTERTYVHWIKHYIFFHNKKHPIEMGKEKIEASLVPYLRIWNAYRYSNYQNLSTSINPSIPS